MKVALPVEYGKNEEPIFDVCASCKRPRTIAYAIDETHEWTCKDCAQEKAIPLSPLQAKVFLSYKRHYQEYLVTPAIAKELNLEIKVVRRTLDQLVYRGLEIVCQGKRRTHQHQLSIPDGTKIDVTENQWQVYQLVMQPNLLRQPAYIPRAASLTNISIYTLQNTVGRLRAKGIYIPTQQERRRNLLDYLRNRIEQEGLTTNSLRTPQFCVEIGVALSSMEDLIRDLRCMGVAIERDTLRRRLCQEVKNKSLSGHELFLKLGQRWSPRSIQRALDYLVERRKIICLNPQVVPSKKIYAEVQS